MIIIGEDQVEDNAVGLMLDILGMQNVDDPIIVSYLDEGGFARPPHTVATVISDLMAGANAPRIALVIDLAYGSGAITPDPSYGLRVVRELALIRHPNAEPDEQDRVRRAIRELYGYEEAIIVFHSNFALEPGVIEEYWHLGAGEIQERPAREYRNWRDLDFEHSGERPFIYSTYKSHGGWILPKVAQWSGG